MTRSGFTFVIAILLLGGVEARAGMLDKDGCTKLKDEQAQLEQAGVRTSMAKGPQWAKANLAPDKLEQVRRLIEVDEQLLFRCQGRPLVNLPNEVDADPKPKADEAKTEQTPAANAVPPKAAAKSPDAVKKAAPAKKAAAPAADKTGDEAKREPAAKKAPAAAKTTDAPAKAKAAKAKPKVDDAYRPPNPDSTANPFAGQDFQPAKK
ncbi:MAG: hypothetical protein F9K29_20625 [Hyphomicrobiaceae bacterium]|nr:MAG: hypothetical protein F9K29_20625 [Hyphomicrobiaceae bacterium]